MSAETLRRAAEAIRNDWRDEEEGREFMFAVADWLDHESHQPETEHEGGYSTGGPCLQALVVANTYLEETP